jgi:hypothetical protein
MLEPLKNEYGTFNALKEDHGTIKKEESEAPDDENDVTLLNALSTRSGLDGLSKQEIHKIVGEAHHDLLYTCGNSAYKNVWEELHRIK